MPQPQIRAASSFDVPAIAAIVDSAYGPYIQRIGRKPAPMLDDYGRLVGSGCVWVLTTDGAVAGLIVLRREADHVLIDNVAVGHAHQGRGHGRRLLDHAETFARRNGFEELRLYTNELMHENLALYARLGWEEYARAEQNGLRRVFMRKRIRPDLPVPALE